VGHYGVDRLEGMENGNQSESGFRRRIHKWQPIQRPMNRVVSENATVENAEIGVLSLGPIDTLDVVFIIPESYAVRKKDGLTGPLRKKEREYLDKDYLRISYMKYQFIVNSVIFFWLFMVWHRKDWLNSFVKAVMGILFLTNVFFALRLFGYIILV
jgi:hypothetical protein